MSTTCSVMTSLLGEGRGELMDYISWNYNPLINQYPDANRFYREQAQIVEGFCKENSIECIIKKGTAR